MARIVDLRRLPQATQRDIADFIRDNPRRSDGMHWDISSIMNAREILDLWLQSQGILGWTERIWDFMRYSWDEAADNCLEDAIAELEGQVDVVDGEHGPQPNSAMRVTMLIEQALGRRPIR
jgi:hypothetical protein